MNMCACVCVCVEIYKKYGSLLDLQPLYSVCQVSCNFSCSADAIIFFFLNTWFITMFKLCL